MTPAGFDARLARVELARKRWLVVAVCAAGLACGLVWHIFLGGTR